MRQWRNIFAVAQPNPNQRKRLYHYSIITTLITSTSQSTMSSVRVGPLKQAWFRWKALRLPWRKRFLVGKQLPVRFFHPSSNHHRHRPSRKHILGIPTHLPRRNHLPFRTLAPHRPLPPINTLLLRQSLPAMAPMAALHPRRAPESDRTARRRCSTAQDEVPCCRGGCALGSQAARDGGAQGGDAAGVARDDSRGG